jgi:streptogramin lyase
MRRLVVAALVVLVSLTVARPAAAVPGDVDLEPTLAGATSATFDAEGNLWLTYEGELRRVHPDTMAVDVVADDVEVPTSIVAGPDGELWYVDVGPSSINHIDPDTLTITAVPTESVPSTLFLGPSSSLWYANRDTGRYGPVAPDGTLTEFRDRLDVLTPDDGVSGPGGDVWFLATHGNGDGWIARVDPITGAGSSIALPHGWWTTPLALLAGPDGDLWVMGPGAQVAHLDPASETWTVVEDDLTYYLGGGANWVTSVVAGGQVWVADGRTLARLDPATEDLDVYPVEPLPEYSFDAVLVAESDGTPWLVTDQGVGPVELPAPGETDVTDPTIAVRSPIDRHAYLPSEEVVVDFDCTDASEVVTCASLAPSWWPGPADGATLPSYPTRSDSVFVYARDAAGNTAWVRHSHWVDALCHGRRANVFSMYRSDNSYGRAGPGPDVGVGDYGIFGYGGDDLLCSAGGAAGGRGNDVLFGQDGNNRFEGGPGNDRLVAGRGTDELDGGSGFDVCIGGRGHDTFVNCERTRQE